MTTYRGYIGTYSKGDSKGVYTFTLDTEAKNLQHLDVAAELKDPTFIAVTKTNKLYAVMKEGSEGGIHAFDLDAKSGALTPLNKNITSDGGPCHVAVRSDNLNALSANYHSGSILSYQLKEDGSVGEILSSVTHEGSGPNKDRQEKAHAHFSGFTPDEQFAVAVDLGTDEVVLYKHEEGQLERHFTLNVAPGAGPRHIAFHPHEAYAYIMTELSNEVIVCEYNASLGELCEIQTISTLPEGFVEESYGSAIHLSRDGKFVYVANRGHNSIASFAVNELSGELTLVEIISTEGNWPRDFQLDPSGNFLVASNQESGNMTLYERNQTSGHLTLLEKDIPVPYPVCVVFVQESI
ncbi:lactonase family protein [Shouchella sp. 1P09AA]|uniref:lactonase family protein n=1 Tax=unclassified Shouchella TaxID=2893065 RepID=UPI0039A3F1B1